MKYVILVFAAVAILYFTCAEAGRDYDLSKEDRVIFNEWLEEFPQKKKAPENVVLQRFEKFKKNLAKMREKNKAKADPDDAEFGPNEYSDMDEAEFLSTHANVPPEVLEKIKQLPQEPVPTKRAIEKLRKSKDWRRAKPKVVGSVKNQGQCGSCWAFGTIGNIEGVWAKSGKKFRSLSEQQLVDCSKRNSACNGGWQVTAFEELIKKKMSLADERKYKYQAKKGKCKNQKGVVKITGYVSIASGETAIKAALLKYGPLSALIDSNNFQNYKRGVMNNCGDNVNHAVVIVGYGKYHGKSVWIVRNSWGRKWGMGGYIMVSQNGNSCGVRKGVCTATVD